MFHVVLVEPQIPPNTGNIIRLCANTGFHLHLIEPLGFSLNEKNCRRAGMDYALIANVTRWKDWSTCLKEAPFTRWVTLSTHHTQVYSDFVFKAGDALVFGSEGKGLPSVIRDNSSQTAKLTLPMQADSRSINLANTVSIVMYEAWRQSGFLLNK